MKRKRTRAVIRKGFTLVIPKEIREQLQLKIDEPVMVTIDDDRIIIKLIRDNPFKQLAELGKGVVFDRSAREQVSDNLQEFALK